SALVKRSPMPASTSASRPETPATGAADTRSTPTESTPTILHGSPCPRRVTAVGTAVPSGSRQNRRRPGERRHATCYGCGSAAELGQQGEPESGGHQECGGRRDDSGGGFGLQHVVAL